MKRSENEALFKRVISYFQNQALGSKITTVKHFQNEGIHRNTIYKMLKRFETTNSTSYRKLPGRSVKVATPKLIKTVSSQFQKDPSTSTYAVAKRFGASQPTVWRTKTHKLGIKTYTKQSAPKYVKDQAQRAKSGCRRVYRKQLSKVLVIDDETYVMWDPKDTPGKKYFHASKPQAVSYRHRVKPKAKFPKKILVWQAIDENGNISDPYISEGNMNGPVYLEECIQARLLPFVDKHQNRDEVIFWPDMATSHYTHDVTSYLTEENLDFIKKPDNAPNVPQARGIERFWALCKSEYSKRPLPPNNLRGFKTVWENISKKVAATSGKAVMDSAKKRLRAIGYKGIEGL